MNIEDNFLIVYGLQHYVTYAKSGGRHVFAIKGGESSKMINHAETLIKGRHGADASIRIA